METEPAGLADGLAMERHGRRRTPEQSAAFVKGLQKKTEKPKISFRFQV